MCGPDKLLEFGHAGATFLTGGLFLIKDITLGQFLKYRNVVSSGGEAKMMLREADVKVNGEPERRRGRKLKPGDTVEVDGKTFAVE